MNNDEAKNFLNKGNACLAANEFDQAIKDYSQAIKLNPEYTSAFYNRGSAYSAKEEYDRAIEDYSQAIALDPERDDAYYNRGGVYSSKGEYDQAIKDYTQAIALDPKRADAYYNRGRAYSSKGEYERAIEDYSQAITLNPEQAHAFHNRGLIYRRIDKEKEAIHDFQEANKLDPTVIPKKESEKIDKRVAKAENFREILEGLKTEYETEEKRWSLISAVAVIFVFTILVILGVLTFFYPETEYKILYPFYIFSSIITFIVIRQYTNAKQLRIEASNRLAMAKMFEKIQQTKDNPHYQDFIPRIIDSIAYSMYKDHKESKVQIIEELKSIKKLLSTSSH